MDATDPQAGRVRDHFGQHAPTDLALAKRLAHDNVFEIQIVAGQPVMRHPDHLDRIIGVGGQAKERIVVSRLQGIEICLRLGIEAQGFEPQMMLDQAP